MKSKIVFLSVLLTLISFEMSGDDSQTAKINLEHTNHGGYHNNLPMPADEPDVYHDIINQAIIIDGLGVVNYYDVEIASASSFVTVITTQVNGYYDTIDISTLPQGEYVITIESPWGNTYEGYFDIIFLNTNDKN